ncbi:MAG: Asp-tRNA(Asn)/Glu-tRNA(Gln) amidotransferase subunit GatC [Armatimonadetes bacterium]|nr:Asp-tRNA(Asn)/Glu-tRNA(Gln) amidotransferase subunit GatC [Armatimonadota bacterium]
MTTVAPEDVRAVGALARIALTDTELDRLTHQMNDLLAQFDRLGELDTGNIPAMSHAVPVVARLREDVARPSLPRDVALSGGSQTDPWLGGFIVPQVLAE